MLILPFLVILAHLGTSTSHEIFSERIIGGHEARIKNQHQVSILDKGAPVCGGSIISQSWILTAAHCTYGSYPSELMVRAGSQSIEEGGQLVTVDTIINHEYYRDPKSETLYDFDISLLHLAFIISIRGADIIPLPWIGRKLEVGDELTIYGWGRTSTKSERLSPTLRVVTLPLVSRKICAKVFGNATITDRMLCAGFLRTGGKGICYGDSGGSAVVGGELVGIASTSDMICAKRGSLDVFTSVIALRKWIWEKTGI